MKEESTFIFPDYHTGDFLGVEDTWNDEKELIAVVYDLKGEGIIELHLTRNEVLELNQTLTEMLTLNDD